MKCPNCGSEDFAPYPIWFPGCPDADWNSISDELREHKMIICLGCGRIEMYNQKYAEKIAELINRAKIVNERKQRLLQNVSQQSKKYCSLLESAKCELATIKEELNNYDITVRRQMELQKLQIVLAKREKVLSYYSSRLQPKMDKVPDLMIDPNIDKFHLRSYEYEKEVVKAEREIKEAERYFSNCVKEFDEALQGN